MPTRIRSIALGRPVAGVEVEGRGVAHPAGQARLRWRPGDPAGHRGRPARRARRSGTCSRIRRRNPRIRAGQVDLQRPGRMGEVPDRPAPRPRAPAPSGRRMSWRPPGAIVDLGQHQRRRRFRRWRPATSSGSTMSQFVPGVQVAGPAPGPCRDRSESFRCPTGSRAGRAGRPGPASQHLVDVDRG